MSNHSEQVTRILLVEDQETIRFLVSETLTQAGFQVQEAESGIEALEFLKQDQMPDLVVLDVVMPEMDGYTVCEAIRANESQAHLPVLVMTSLEDEASIERAYAAGATDFISKPFKNVVLVNRIRYMLRAHRTEQKAHRLAFFDQLTGLPNRELFKESLARAVELAQKHEQGLAVLSLDLQDVRRISETMGHGASDLVLRDAAHRIATVVKNDEHQHSLCQTLPSNLVSRIDGGQFAVLLTSANQVETAVMMAQRIVDVLDQPFCIGENETFVRTGMGLALFPKDGISPTLLHENATTAMNHGRSEDSAGLQVFEQSMNDAASKRLIMDSQLRKALIRNEFEVWYQPQVNSSNGQVCGLEALLRWNCAELGPVSPADFIPLAEDSGAIVEIGEWVLREACAQACRWRRQGFEPGRIAINISALQFAQPEFVSVVQGILEQTGLAARHVELEITESLLMKDVSRANKTLVQLKSLGLQLAIDDFGTGYSSLSYLKKFPVDRLKIDRSFVRDITTDADDAAIATAVMGMAANMNMEVIAEGVETEAQMSFLIRKGCTEFQGYYLSAPMNTKDTTRYLKNAADVSVRTNGSAPPENVLLLLVDDDAAERSLRETTDQFECEAVSVSTQRAAFEKIIELDPCAVLCWHGESNDFMRKLKMLFSHVAGVDLKSAPGGSKADPKRQIQAHLSALRELVAGGPGAVALAGTAQPLMRRLADQPAVAPLVNDAFPRVAGDNTSLTTNRDSGQSATGRTSEGRFPAKGLQDMGLGRLK